MRIGAMTFTAPWNGGAFQYESLVLDTLARLHKSGEHDVSYLFLASVWSSLALMDAGEVTVRGIPLKLAYGSGTTEAELYSGLGEVIASGTQPDLARLIQYRSNAPDIEATDWVFFPTPTMLGQLLGKPFVMPIHDLQHRLQPHFPEVSKGGEADKREFMYRNACRTATLIIVDSDVGKEDVLACYGDVIRPDRIMVVPFAPMVATQPVEDAQALAEVRTRYGLPERFFFYPAQFWFHKNHRRVVEALDIVSRRHGEPITIAFTSKATDEIQQATFQELTGRIGELGLTDRVRFLGYVPAEDLAPLYSQAVALVMPTFFGPTNIPILEAWGCGCPVITSDIRGVRDQAGDAALLVDPNSVEAIAGAMDRLWSDADLRQELISRGRKRSAELAQYDFRNRIDEVIAEMCQRVAAGDYPPIERLWGG